MATTTTTDVIGQLRTANDDLVTAVKCAVAALTQSRTYPADIDLAVAVLRGALTRARS